ncbi:hypothetical protein BU23DRAFT_549968 [Bimuria novae-zelandiae CBS 107.79]|uniref:Endoplasmic reticulum junction formation protein lunapark n=1 Tax=Bimuria novae-zelandiae CBS 107.79 TaxID=1447943 RepID=A0A6A5VMP9_9PLEO|nr:hypothetical protein BU23DRAFT_549968 [Bimuria novae-zelandiae CBS 107.79]
MVSFWPFKSGEDAAYYERTLSTLTGKIQRASARNDAIRQRSKRFKVMWTLWAGFAYIFCVLFWSLIVGYKNWGPTEYTALAGGPLIFYLVRTTTARYWEWRITSTEAYIKTLSRERDGTIERLKESTKYNSTQQLLDKYSSQPKAKNPSSPAGKKSQGAQKPGPAPGPRTGIVPPPTANIQRPPNQRPGTPQRSASAAGSPQGPAALPALPPPEAPGAEFAPNAFTPAELTRQYSSAPPPTFTETHWYDRIMDALLGEDETQPKNRLALICSECRLVNGQAPPGSRTLEDVGRWRCGECHAWNGKEKVEEVAVSQLVQGWEEERNAREKELSGTDGGIDSDNRETEDDAGVVGGDEGSGVDIADESIEEAPVRERTTRSKSKAKGKK